MSISEVPAEIRPKILFGIKTDLRGNCHFLEDDIIFFPSGAVFVVHELETQEQRFIYLPKSQSIVTSITISPNR